MYNLTGIYWIKNEGRYLPEYLEFHLMQGFDHFIFYDNGSTDGTREILEPYGDLVELRTYPDGLNISKNSWVMDYCIQEQAFKTRWLHYHAIDERLISPTGKSLPEMLSEYENYGGVSVAWQLINSSGHIYRPEGLLMENYFDAAKDPMYHIKTIFQPHLALQHAGHPHNFLYQPGLFSVTENHNAIYGAFSPDDYTMNKLKLYHYITLSKEEFEVKMNKGVLDRVECQDSRRPDVDFQWSLAHDIPIGRDESLFEWVEPTRAAILERYRHNPEILERINH
jgi:glycosyltransferase involved in cell wall biosynthesis